MNDLLKTVQSLAATLSPREREILLQALAPARPAIAVVGIGCRFPGGADGPDGFWRLLDGGVDAVTEVPADRFDVDRFYDADPEAPGRSLTRYGAFLDGVDRFDAGFFGVSPHEARRMDPQQRLLLEVAWEALEDAGRAPDALRGSASGVFIGGCSHDYDELSPRPSDAHTLTGGLLSVLAGRLSHTLGLQGPSLTVDTACSSSLVALHLACASLRAGECDLALAGGANVILSPEGYARLSRMRALSPDGRCRTFDARANGYVRGEGVGVVVLRRLEDARRDGDRVWAVIRGSAVNHDGRSPSLTAPNGLSQRDVIRRALADAGVSAEAIDYVEAHGTGTPLGDPIEMESLRELFAGPRAAPCVVGSVKTNIGHLEAAAGIAGVIKVVLALAHERIPRHLHFTRLNPRIDLGGALDVPSEARSWRRGGRERVAGVSSFGISGTNAHVIIGEAAPPAADVSTEERAVVLPLSAHGPAALRERVRQAIEALRAPNGPSPIALARTLATRRAHLDARVAVVARTRAELAGALEAIAIPDGAPRVGTRPRLVVIATGEADLALGARLLRTEPVFRQAARAAEERIPGGASVLDEIARGATGRGAPWAAWVIEQGLVALLRAYGVAPDAVVGRGRGEVTAALIAGVITADEAANLLGPQAIAPSASRRAGLPLACASLGGRTDGLELDAAHWACFEDAPEHLAEAVRALVASTAGESTIALVLGDPGSVRLPASLPVEVLSIGGDAAIEGAIARLYARGFPIAWSAVYPGAAPPVSLPCYPWQHEHLWFEQPAAAAMPAEAPSSGHAIFGEAVEVPAVAGLRVFRGVLDAARAAWLADHRAGGTAVAPAAAILDGAAWAARSLGGVACAREVVFERVLDLPGGAGREVQLAVHDGVEGRFELFARDADGRWQRHAHGRLGDVSAGIAAGPIEETDLAALRARMSPVDVAALYGRLEAAGLAYGPSFRALREVWAAPGEAVARVHLPGGLDGARHLLHPALLDGCLQVTAAAVSRIGGLPVGVARASLDATAFPVELFCHARVRETDTLVEADLAILDDRGRRLAAIDGFRVERAATAVEQAAAPVEAAPGRTIDRAALAGIVTASVRRVLGFDAGMAIPAAQDLRDLGMDSLLALDLAAALGAELGCEVRNSLAWDYPSIAEMIEALAQQLGLGEAS